MTAPLRLVVDESPPTPAPSLDRYRGRLFLKVAEVAALTDTDPRTVRRAIQDDQIPAVRIGDTIRVPAAPFWQLCGLDPETLRGSSHDEHQPGPENASGAGPNETGPDLTTTPGERACENHASRTPPPAKQHTWPLVTERCTSSGGFAATVATSSTGTTGGVTTPSRSPLG